VIISLVVFHLTLLDVVTLWDEDKLTFVLRSGDSFPGGDFTQQN
jgi:hypothetical protein